MSYKDTPTGWVYVMSNPALPDLFKVGMTTRPVKDRVKELNSASGVPLGFKVELVLLTEEPYKKEQMLHKLLTQYRVNKGREFFRAPIELIISTVQSVCEPEYVRKMREKLVILEDTEGYIRKNLKERDEVHKAILKPLKKTLKKEQELANRYFDLYHSTLASLEASIKEIEKLRYVIENPENPEESTKKPSLFQSIRDYIYNR